VLKGQFEVLVIQHIINAIVDDFTTAQNQSFILSAVRAQPAILTIGTQMLP
jgi:hypothetical protein